MGNYTCYAEGYENIYQTHIFQVNGKKCGIVLIVFSSVDIQRSSQMTKKGQYFGHLWEELTHWKISWYWERLKAGGEGDDRGLDSWMASPTQWTWVWESSGSWWWTGKPGRLQSMWSQRVGHDWETKMTETVTIMIIILHKDVWLNQTVKLLWSLIAEFHFP